ncbi:AMP-binding protein [Cupriavidus sp. KK10]|jgi:acyl-CoA synthetase (AMP-forming)/AMP-acid ligase II|uniref:class I adenylate-forming enzyme family protein n=1 Tax=Cupriavidus sp. KK10 TaxID=1478019 RepID=UPI001BADCA33|nr:AMP-binding protein [Cupriavidus sp. KK10]QUN30497.1 AMP-binding protein [Cupriavidus sp. KK10]
MNPNLAQMLVRTARAYPDQAALYLGTERLCTFEQLADRVARCACGLRDWLGLQAGDRVALVMKNCPQYVELLYGIWHAGLCAVPINARLHPREIEGILHDSGARVSFAADAEAVSGARTIVVGSTDYHALFAAHGMPVTDVSEDALAWLFYTSGTTGKPKGVMLSHRNLGAMSHAYASAVTRILPGDSLIHAAPMSHGSGLYLVPHMAEGASQVVPPSGGFDAGELAGLVAAHQRPSVFAAPTMLNRLVEYARRTRADVSNLKVVVCGGAPLYVEDEIAAVECLGPRIAQIYGQGESPMTITAQSSHEIGRAYAVGDLKALASVGHALPGVEIRIADAGDRALPVGEVGEVLVRGPTVMQGYWNNPEASVATLRNGWLHTGDVGCVDEQGQLTLKDRSKDTIISGGSNIYPREVEDALLAHAAVAEVSVIGRRHPVWGEEVVAVVVLKAGMRMTQSELDQWCLRRIARFKRPKAYLFVNALPKNSNGKVLKTALRELLAQGGEQANARTWRWQLA